MVPIRFSVRPRSLGPDSYYYIYPPVTATTQSHATRNFCSRFPKSAEPRRYPGLPISAGYFTTAAPTILIWVERPSAPRQHGGCYRRFTSYNATRSTRRQSNGSPTTLQVSSLRQGFSSFGTSDKAYSYAHGGKASRLPIPWMYKTLQPVRRTHATFTDTQQSKFKKRQ